MPSTTTTSPSTGGALGALGRLLRQPIGFGASRAAKPARANVSVGHKQMRRELYTLLQRHPDSRRMLRHLDVIERTLRHIDIDAVQGLPLKVLTKGLDELESLVWDWSPAGLAELRSRLAVTIKQRRHEMATSAARPERYESTPRVDTEGTEVEEVSAEVYEEMERSWSGQMPATVAAALQAHHASSAPADAGGGSHG